MKKTMKILIQREDKEMAQVFARKAGLFQTERKGYTNRNERKNNKQELSKYWR